MLNFPVSAPSNAASYSVKDELVKRNSNQQIYEENFINPILLSSLSTSGAGSSEIIAGPANTNFLSLIGGRQITLGTVANASWSRIAATGRTIVPGLWQMNILGYFGWNAANATPLATPVNNTVLFMGLHFNRFTSNVHTAAIGFHYNDSGCGIFVANNSLSSIILPATPLFLPQNVTHKTELIIDKLLPKVDLYVNGVFVVSTTSANIPQYNNVSRCMNMEVGVIKYTADAVNVPVRYTIDNYAVLLER